MVKITILSERKRDTFHSIIAFYDYKGIAINECECGKLIYEQSYNFQTKQRKTHTIMFSHEEFKNLKKALLEAI